MHYSRLQQDDLGRTHALEENSPRADALWMIWTTPLRRDAFSSFPNVVRTGQHRRGFAPRVFGVGFSRRTRTDDHEEEESQQHGSDGEPRLFPLHDKTAPRASAARATPRLGRCSDGSFVARVSRTEDSSGTAPLLCTFLWYFWLLAATTRLETVMSLQDHDDV